MIALNLHMLTMALFGVLLLGNEEGLFVVFLALFFAGCEIAIWAHREFISGRLNWCHPVPVFVLGYCIIFYQLPFVYLAGYNLGSYSEYVLFSSENISYCVLLAAIGLSSFFSGEQFLYLKRPKTFKTVRISTGEEVISLNQNLRFKKINYFILFCTVLFFYFYLNSLGGLILYLITGYGNIGKISQAYSSYFGFAYTILLYLAILLQIYKISKLQISDIFAYARAWDKATLLVVATTLTPFLLSGDRGSYLQPVALIVAPYFILVKPLSFFKAAGIVLFFAFLLVVVGDIRGRFAGNFVEALTARVESVSNPAEWPSIELANSFGTFNIATVYFPDRYEYQNGMNAFYKIMGIIPFSNFFTEVSKKNIETEYVLSSSLFFTNILTKGTFSSGSGTSSLGDIYLDFGPFGIPIVLFLWGIFMGWISNKTFANYSPIFIFLYAYYSYTGIYVNRSSFFFGWNQFVWVILLFYFIKHLYLEKERG
jgi:oligosaccharide repeat unit polymerase